LCGARPQPAKLLKQFGFERHVGRENICPHIGAALQRAEQVHLSQQVIASAALAPPLCGLS
jgi:sulfate permease, SulP family